MAHGRLACSMQPVCVHRMPPPVRVYINISSLDINRLVPHRGRKLHCSFKYVSPCSTDKGSTYSTVVCYKDNPCCTICP